MENNEFVETDIVKRATLISIDIDDKILARNTLTHVNLYVPVNIGKFNVFIEYTYFPDGTYKERGRQVLLLNRWEQSFTINEACETLGMSEQTNSIKDFFTQQSYNGDKIDVTNKGDYFGAYIVNLDKRSTLQFAKDYGYQSDVISCIEDYLTDGAWVEIGFYVKKSQSGKNLKPERTALYVTM